MEARIWAYYQTSYRARCEDVTYSELGRFTVAAAGCGPTIIQASNVAVKIIIITASTLIPSYRDLQFIVNYICGANVMRRRGSLGSTRGRDSGRTFATQLYYAVRLLIYNTGADGQL